MVFTMPAGYRPVPVQAEASRDNPYQYAIRPNQGKMEVRYMIRSLQNADTGQVNPNELFKSLALVTAANVSQEHPASLQCDHFPKDAVKSEFGADDGVVMAFNPRTEFGKNYQVCLMFVIHRDNVADATVYCLFDDRAMMDAFGQDSAAFHALRFR